MTKRRSMLPRRRLTEEERIQRQLADKARTAYTQLPEYRLLEEVLTTAGVPEHVAYQGSKRIASNNTEVAKRNFTVAAEFFSHLFAEPAIREDPNALFSAVMPLVAEPISNGGDVRNGLWAFSQAVRDSEDPRGLCAGLSQIKELNLVKTGMTHVTSVWSDVHVDPDTARQSLEVLSRPETRAILDRYLTKGPLWESFLKAAALHPNDVLVRLEYDRAIAEGRLDNPVKAAEKLMQAGDMVNVSILPTTGLVGVGPSSKGHKLIEEEAGLAGDFAEVRDRIIPATLIQPDAESAYELILPPMKVGYLGDERLPLTFHFNPLMLVAAHMGELGFPDFVVRVQGFDEFMTRDVSLSQASLPGEAVESEESFARKIDSPDELMRHGYLRVRQGDLANLALLSVDAEKKHISQGDTFCPYRWDSQGRTLQLGWSRTKHVIDADPKAVYEHVKSRRGPWDDIKVFIDMNRW
ncbi:MAG: hypothetical protein ABH834_06750 [Candidatus Altiarchaeota archaeon]